MFHVIIIILAQQFDIPYTLVNDRLESNYDNIMKTNFSMQRIGSNTGNMGYYGKGVYFSSYPQYSVGYAGSNCLLVCLVFTGKAFPLKQIVMGCPKVSLKDTTIM